MLQQFSINQPARGLLTQLDLLDCLFLYFTFVVFLMDGESPWLRLFGPKSLREGATTGLIEKLVSKNIMIEAICGLCGLCHV